MPTYCYETPKGGIIERFFRMGDAPQSVTTEDGMVADRSYRAEQKAVPSTKGWPMECFASGVHPDQAQDLRNHLNECGVPTEVSSNGNPVYRDAGHRKRALKARGFHDKQSFF